MSIFSNDFFSVAGQKERLANVGNTLLAAVGIKKGGVQSNTGLKPVDTVLSAAASYPFVTAGVVAGGMLVTGTKAPAAFTNVAQPVAGKAISSFSALSGKQKAVAVVSSLVVPPALVTSPKLRSAVASAPSGLVNFGANVGSLVEDPSISNLSKIAKENPVIAAGAVATGLIGAGAAVRGVASIAATAINTGAIRENTGVAAAAGQSVLGAEKGIISSPSVAGNTALAAPVANSEVKTPIIPAGRSVSTTRKRRKTKQKTPSMTQNVKVYNIDDRDINDRKVYKERK